MQDIDSLSLLLPPVRSAAPADLTNSLPTWIWLFSPWVTVPTAGVVLLVAYYFMRRSARQGAINQAVAVAAQMAQEEAQRMELENLRASNEHLLALLRKRDRYMVQYEAMSLLDEEGYAKWAKATWKTVACNQLAMTKAVRPLLYADYRARIRILSETYGTGPGPALAHLKQQLQWAALPMPLMEEPDFLTDSTDAIPVEEASSVTDVLAWLDAANSSITVVPPVAVETLALPSELSTRFDSHLDQRNREVEALFAED